MDKSKCDICKTTECKHWLGCLGGWLLCVNCAKDYRDFTLQSPNEQNIVILMEVYFRRGKREEITYEELHKEKSDLKFISFTELFKMEDKSKQH